MAFFLTPRFAPAYQHCGPFGAPSRPRHVARPSAPSFIPFLSQLDGLVSELDREARRAAHKQRQQRKRQFRASFDVKEHKERYEIEGDVPGFEQQNISIEVTDEHTLKISGDTEQRVEQPVSEQQTTDAQTEQTEQMEGLTLNEPEASQDEKHGDSDTESRTSYQATVEDDFEDLGAEAVSRSSTPAEPKGKEKAVEGSVPVESTVQKQAQPEVPAQQQQEPEFREWLSERVQGSFERTFQFPERIDMANVKASLKNGVLSLSVPKAPAFEPKRITIQ
jgi:HSP20 family molecular chaperone IbpA